MSAKTFYLKTSNTDIIALFENTDNKSKYIEEAVLHFMSCKIHETKEQLDLKYKKLRNNKMSLEMIKLVKETGQSKNWEKTKQIITAEEEVEPPKLTSIENQEEEQGGLNGYSMCSFCKHEHVGTEPRVCKKLDCNCGVRG